MDIKISWRGRFLEGHLGGYDFLAEVAEKSPQRYWTWNAKLSAAGKDGIVVLAAHGWDRHEEAARARAEQAVWLMLALVEVQNANLYQDPSRIERMLDEVRAHNHTEPSKES